MEMLQQIFEICILPLIGILTAFLIAYINAKKEEIVQKSENQLVDKYTVLIADTVSTCVLATSQTYVDSLKSQGKFDADAQKAAFQQTYSSIVAMLPNEVKKYIEEIYGDLALYLQQKIEAEVSINK